VLVDYFTTAGAGLNYSLEQFQQNINPVLEQLADSPLHGLPPILMTRDPIIVEKISKTQDYLLEIKITINLIGSGRFGAQDKNFIREQIEKFTKLNSAINEILEELEKKLF
jgi:hypothetical protein